MALELILFPQFTGFPKFPLLSIVQTQISVRPKPPSLSDTKYKNFFPFISDIVGWVEDDIGEDELADMKSKLDAQIEEEVNPTEGSAGSGDMPWDEDDGA